jgi:signal transduction histidine kinase
VTGNPAVMLQLPLGSGAVLGTVSLEQLAMFLHRHLGQVEAMEFALVDHHGTLIAHTRQQFALERANLLAQHPEILELLGSGTDIPIRLHEDSSLIESIRVVPASGWIVHAAIPVAVLKSKSEQMRLVLLPTIAGAVLLASFLAFWQSRRLIRPLIGLREGADALAMGNGQQLEQFGQTGYAELDTLSAHLRDMAGVVLERETFLRASEESHRQLSQQFSALLEGITDRIDLISPDLHILWSNHGGGHLIPGRDLTGPAGCCFASRFHRSEPCPHCPALRCFASGQPESSELGDAQGRIYSLRAFPVKDQQGTVVQVIVISEDITEKRAGEQQQLRASQLASLGELAAGVAHEINNPISGVINYAQLIVNHTAAESREHDLARRIIKEGDRIATIVRELLIFARDEDQELRRISLREALSEALVLCENHLRKDRIDLRIQVPADLPLLESRSHQIEQLLLNLLVNARHALAEKYPDGDSDKILAVSAETVELDGRPFVRIKIRDHGTGIAPELLGKVMNPFFTTKPAGIGTGLGLSISFEIAKRHGGALRLVSDYGQWTEVVVDLPACAAEAAPRVLP